jgi:citrate synthase
MHMAPSTSRLRPELTTQLCHATVDTVYIRGRNLCTELIGNVSFTQMLFLDILGRLPDPQEIRVVDAVFVTLMEHGLAPSAIATRLTYASAPEALQGAVAAGLLGAGSVMLGTLEGSAKLLNEIVASADGIDAAARRVAFEHKTAGKPVTGFGHPLHKPNDPRTTRLFDLAGEWGLPGRHVAAAQALGRAVDEVFGKHLTMNASLACGALLAEIGMPLAIVRGFAIITRAAGLIAHIYEEQRNPIAWQMATIAQNGVTYRAPPEPPDT